MSIGKLKIATVQGNQIVELVWEQYLPHCKHHFAVPIPFGPMTNFLGELFCFLFEVIIEQISSVLNRIIGAIIVKTESIRRI